MLTIFAFLNLIQSIYLNNNNVWLNYLLLCQVCAKNYIHYNYILIIKTVGGLLVVCCVVADIVSAADRVSESGFPVFWLVVNLHPWALHCISSFEATLKEIFWSLTLRNESLYDRVLCWYAVLHYLYCEIFQGTSFSQISQSESNCNPFHSWLELLPARWKVESDCWLEFMLILPRDGLPVAVLHVV